MSYVMKPASNLDDSKPIGIQFIEIPNLNGMLHYIDRMYEVMIGILTIRANSKSLSNKRLGILLQVDIIHFLYDKHVTPKINGNIIGDSGENLHDHSLLNAFTGFALAALSTFNPTVATASTIMVPPLSTNTHQLRPV